MTRYWPVRRRQTDIYTAVEEQRHDLGMPELLGHLRGPSTGEVDGRRRLLPGLAVIVNAQDVVRDLFRHFMARPADLPAEWSHGLDDADADGRIRRICDFIAGMTDRYALIEHARHFDSTPELS